MNLLLFLALAGSANVVVLLVIHVELGVLSGKGFEQ